LINRNLVSEGGVAGLPGQPRGGMVGPGVGKGTMEFLRRLADFGKLWGGVYAVFLAISIAGLVKAGRADRLTDDPGAVFAGPASIVVMALVVTGLFKLFSRQCRLFRRGANEPSSRRPSP
jgi:hypothetical protein